jgi:hypothetical protein
MRPHTVINVLLRYKLGIEFRHVPRTFVDLIELLRMSPVPNEISFSRFLEQVNSKIWRLHLLFTPINIHALRIIN